MMTIYQLVNDRYGDPIPVTIDDVNEILSLYNNRLVSDVDTKYAQIIGDKIFELDSEDPFHREIIAEEGEE